MNDLALKQAQILVVGDEAVVTAVRRMLEPIGYTNIHQTTDTREVVQLYDHAQPDIVLVDLQLAGGFEAVEMICTRIPENDYVPVLALTPGTDSQDRLRCLAKGAKDFLSQPLEATEVLTRVANLLENRFLYLQSMGDARIEYLADDVARARTRSLEDIQVELLERFARTAEYKDLPEHGHRERVAALSRLLAVQLGFTPERADLIGRAALLHDVGKIGVPECIWQKPERLTPEEFEQVKSHTEIGAEILSQGRSPLLWLAEEIAHTHHERWDGNGYLGLAGESVPVAGRIVAVADTYDALTHDRPYRAARSPEEAIEEIERETDHQFDPRIVEAFQKVKLTPEFAAVFLEED